MMDDAHWYIIVIALIDPLNSTVLFVEPYLLHVRGSFQLCTEVWATADGGPDGADWYIIVRDPINSTVLVFEPN